MVIPHRAHLIGNDDEQMRCCVFAHSRNRVIDSLFMLHPNTHIRENITSASAQHSSYRYFPMFASVCMCVMCVHTACEYVYRVGGALCGGLSLAGLSVLPFCRAIGLFASGVCACECVCGATWCGGPYLRHPTRKYRSRGARAHRQNVYTYNTRPE